MEEARNDSDMSQENDSIIEEQLAQYARDLQELYQGRESLERTAAETQQRAQLRSHEVAALNKFLQGRLGEMFELEAEYETLLDGLGRVADSIQPPMLRRTIQAWVEHGHQVLDRIRGQRA